jgi:hypothetical protein
MAWSGKELVLFAHELVPQPGATKPSLVLAAALDPESGAWRRLPDSKILGQGARWFAAGGKLILPALGSADGGEVGNWGRAYPNGGILDPASGTWSKLPRAPADDAVSGGVLAGSRADYFGTNGWILDATAGEWIGIPTLDQVTGRTVAAAGTDMLALGGVRWNGPRGRLLRETWLWTAQG